MDVSEIENIRRQYAEGVALHLIAKWHKVTESAVCQIALGRSYPDSLGPIATARRGSKIRPDARRLSADDVRAIRELAGLVPQRDLAEIYGVCRGMVRKIIARTVYSDVPDE